MCVREKAYWFSELAQNEQKWLQWTHTNTHGVCHRKYAWVAVVRASIGSLKKELTLLEIFQKESMWMNTMQKEGREGGGEQLKRQELYSNILHTAYMRIQIFVTLFVCVCACVCGTKMRRFICTCVWDVLKFVYSIQAFKCIQAEGKPLFSCYPDSSDPVSVSASSCSIACTKYIRCSHLIKHPACVCVQCVDSVFHLAAWVSVLCLNLIILLA